MSSCFKVFIKIFFSFLCFFLLIFYPALLCAKSKNLDTESANIDLTYQTLPHRQNLATQDIFDIDSMMSAHATSLLSKKFVQKLQSKKIIAISDIENTTQESIDIESMMIGFKQSVVEKFVFTNAIASNANKADKLIKDSRTLRNNAEYNQYTTKEEGGLLAPDYSLSGKISKRAKSIGKEVRLEYAILLRLTDLATGVEVWSNIAKSTKILPKNVAQKYLQESKNQKSTATPNTPKTTISNSEWEKAYEKCLSEDFGACQRLVDNGLANVEQCDKESCNKIGTILRNIGRLDEAVEYYKRAISLGDYEGYRYLGILDSSFKKDFTNAKKNYEIACDKYKEKESCFLLAIMYEKNEGIPQDTQKATYYHKKACDLGSEICKSFNLLKTTLQESKQQWEDCTKYKNASACKKIIDSGFPSADKYDDKQACNDIGIIYNLAGYPKQAIPYYERAISLGYDKAYFNLGLLYQQNNDKEKAKKYYQPACDKGIYEACYALSAFFIEERDFFNAKKNFEILCDKSNSSFKGDACALLGTMYVNGEGVRQDYNRAFEYYKKSCELKSPAGCNNLGVAYYFGQGVREDFSLAKQYYGKACDLGSQKACDNYKRLNLQHNH
ncbi:tetratricopeptide repeat protein [Helicobacter sp. T3_23-1056]